MTNTIKNLEYPLNLIYAVFEDEAEEIAEKADIIPDFDASIEYVLYTLSERERKIIKNRFVDLLTLEQTGKLFGVTRDRIRQIEAKAIRKLRHPSRAKYFRYGVSAIIENIRTDYYNKFSELEGRLIEICKLNAKTADEVIQDKELRKKYAPTNIEAIDLSVRSYNCLKRAGIGTLQQLAQLSYNDLIRIRNLGRRSVDEIIGKLNEYGYEIQGSDKEEQNHDKQGIFGVHEECGDKVCSQCV